MGLENELHGYYFLWGVCAFNFCLNMAILLFVFFLWLDVYHKRWLKKMDEMEIIIRNMRRR